MGSGFGRDSTQFIASLPNVNWRFGRFEVCNGTNTKVLYSGRFSWPTKEQFLAVTSFVGLLPHIPMTVVAQPLSFPDKVF